MDKLTRYLLVGGALIVLGVGLLALSGMGLPFPASESTGVLGAVSMVIGIIMVVGALWIDLSQLNRERARSAGGP
ncbi:MAG: hypothetical protein JRM97_08350 [Nitrososphaerota archaeon]|nr:hypothetical protein [Nitrososphaerota archaeon]MDG6937470.1 hypothetical protein [Nitrososphaerota archaeon]MDG6961994.1 hypothetical protein [Nitrososphaerota archaeon]MDG6962913.1 hypothetical protein [Nitrososphaerota archaeon]MDG6969686.1 hypothetical protein [Nitrososphaerota archaeon]